MAFTPAGVQVWACWSPWQHQHFLHAVHKPVECEEYRAVSVLQHLIFRGKIKTSQDGHDECFEKKLIVKYVLSHFIGGGVTWFGLQDKNTLEFRKTVT